MDSSDSRGKVAKTKSRTKAKEITTKTNAYNKGCNSPTQKKKISEKQIYHSRLRGRLFSGFICCVSPDKTDVHRQEKSGVIERSVSPALTGGNNGTSDRLSHGHSRLETGQCHPGKYF